MSHAGENGYIVRALNQLASLIHQAKSPDSNKGKAVRAAAERKSTRPEKSPVRRKARTAAKFLILIASVAILRRFV